jgi:hypothetical protein
MSHPDLNAAAAAARGLASMVSAIRGLMAAGAREDTIKRLTDQLNDKYEEAQASIQTVVMELRLTRDCAVQLGDVVAPTAHEAAEEMVRALNRERFGVEVIGRKQMQVWPDADKVMAEIELELTKARHHREQAKLLGPAALEPEAVSGEQSVDQPRESLTDNEYTVLRALRDKHSRRVLLPELVADTGIARKACGQVVASLIERGLAERRSERTGATITPAGERLLDATDAPRSPR